MSCAARMTLRHSYLERNKTMRRGFIYAVVAVILLGFCRAEQDDMVTAFEKALADPDIIICEEMATPLFRQADKEGYFANTCKPNELLTRIADQVLDKRISIGAPMAWERFNSMESFMREIVCCDAIAQTNVYFLKLADYLASENLISKTNQLEEITFARKQDKALVDSGAIKLPPIIIGMYPRTPNLRALYNKYRRIDRWNHTAKNHRYHVAGIFSAPISRYLRSLKKEDAEAFRKLFIERAKLSKEEESLFFPEKREEGK